MQNLQYRPYQEECLDAIESAGAGKHLIALATGLGKTVIFTGIPNRGRTLILSHRDELVRQPEKYYKGRGISFGTKRQMSMPMVKTSFPRAYSPYHRIQD